MKRFLIAFAVLSATTGAYAANSLEYDFRGDMQSYDYNTAANKPGYTRFYLKTGRLQYKGSVNDRFSYVLRLGFYKPSADAVTGGGTTPANSKRDSLNSSVEYAYITDKMSDMFALTLGKFNTEIGGFEGATSSADLYLTSPYYNHAAVNSANTGNTLSGSNYGINEGGQRNLLYMTGVKGTLTFAETQNLMLVAVNNISDSADAAGNFNQDRGMMGVIWKGGFLEKTLTGLLSYHEVSPQGATADKGNKHTFASAGVKYDSDWIGSLEYSTTTYKDGATSNKDMVSAGVVKLGYKLEQWTPRLEFYTAEEKTEIAASATNKFTGYGAVVEYKPTAENVRYHVAYMSITAKPETGDDQTRSEIVVGARLLGDFLKQ